MRNLVFGLFSILITIFITLHLNGKLEARLNQKFDISYKACKSKLIAENNYQSTEQAVNCAYLSSKEVRILSTVLGQN
jgi:hypothetical protein